MEAPMSASQGPLRSLPSKLGSLLSGTKHGLQAEEKNKIRILQEDLQVLIANYLLEPSEVESPVSTAHSWMKDVRDLSYDIDDFIYELAQASTSGARINVLQRLPRFKVSRSRFPLKPKRRQWITDEISGFRIRVMEAIRRHKEYVGDWKRRPSSIGLGQRPSPSSPCSQSGTGIRLVGVDSSIEQLCGWLANDEQTDHRVASIVGTGGVGKTTLAREVYRKLGGQFQCLAFVRTSPKPDMKGLLTSVLSQVRPHHLPESCEVHELVQKIYEHLQDKTYFIVIDDLWSLSTCDTVNRALPKGELCSRILTTTEVNVIAQKCCAENSKYFSPKKEDNSTYFPSKTEDNSSYMLSEKEDESKYMPLKKNENRMHINFKKEDKYKYIIKKGPLSEDESRELLLSTVFGHQAECPQGLKEVSNEIITRIGGLPLTINILASLLARLPDSSIQQWNYIKNSLGSGLTRNNSLEGINQVLNLCYDNLPHSLKACMLYLCMYEEDRVILKDDLVNQWMAEGFVCAMEGDDGKEVARSYFDELFSRGIIQPVDINCNDEVLSCSVHHMVLHFIRYKSIEENFSIAIDHSETTIKLADKVRRLALHFGNVEDAITPAPACMRLSKVRSLAFSGLLKCMPSIVEFRFLQVLILKLWADPDNRSDNLTKPDDLTGISELFRLRYFHLDACHMSVALPTQMQQLKDLLAWEIDAQVTAIPSDIVDLPGLLYLRIPSEAHWPTGIGRMTSLRTLGVFDLSKNSTEDVMSLGELTSLQDLCLTCSTIQPDNLEKNLECLGSVIRKLSNLKCVTLVPAMSSHVNTQHDAGASSMSTSWNGFSIVPLPPALLQKLELSWRCCLFSSLPDWTKELTKLCILKIAVRKVSQKDVVILKGLPSLAALSLFIWTAPAIRIIFDNEGFSVLKYFKFLCAVPCLEFLEGAMPNLRKLKLGFNANRMVIIAGLKRLTGLNEISIKIGDTGAVERQKEPTQSVLTDAIGMDPSTPVINVQWVDWNFCGDEEKHTQPQQEIRDQTSEQKNVRAEESSDLFFEEEAKPQTAALIDAHNQVGSSDEHDIQEKNLQEHAKKQPDTRTYAAPGPTFHLQNTEQGRPMDYLMQKMSSSDPQPLKMHLLKTITEDFSKDKIIGSGAYGDVYKGVLNGDEIAVKKLFYCPGFDDEVFKNEFCNIKNVQHENVIRMIGYCLEISSTAVEYEGKLVVAEVFDRAICFEYMKGGSLANHISAESCIHDWPTTYKIISGTSKGLHHLHKGREQMIFHLALTPDNVLLDEELVPKIDFGLSRLFGDKGTKIGFMPPEYIHNSKVTRKYDVFSLGVIIFYMMAGAKGYGNYWDARHHPNFSQTIQLDFIESVLEYWKTKMEATLSNRWDETDILGVTTCVKMAMRCVEDDRHKRPSTTEILAELKELDSKMEEMLNEDPKPLTRQQEGKNHVNDLEQLKSPNDLGKDIAVDPSKELRFLFEPNKDISCCLQLTNRAAANFIAFNVKTDRKKYRAHPDRGTLPPGSNCYITLTSRAQEAPPGVKFLDMATVQATRVPECFTSDKISEDFLEKASSVDEVTLPIVYVALEKPLPE